MILSASLFVKKSFLIRWLSIWIFAISLKKTGYKPLLYSEILSIRIVYLCDRGKAEPENATQEVQVVSLVRVDGGPCEF